MCKIQMSVHDISLLSSVQNCQCKKMPVMPNFDFKVVEAELLLVKGLVDLEIKICSPSGHLR